MKITIDLDTFTPELRERLTSIVGENYHLSLSGKDKSERLESRLRKVISEPRPDTTDYDFCHGVEHYFEKDRVELKQFAVLGKSPKLQQVKPHLYDKILVAAESDDKTDWWILETKYVSPKAGKENKENGKLALARQHKGNEFEGQISYNETFKKYAKFILTTGPVDYKKENLGLEDDILSQILLFVKNH